MLKKIVAGLVVIVVILTAASCSSSNTPSNEPIKATWIEPQVVADTVSIPVSEVENNRNVHFEVETQDSNMNFMAYIVDGETYVRANVCPPCQSIGFSLEETILVCDSCGTTFEAETGEGIQGACVAYPKAAVAYEIKNSSIVMRGSDLLAAYQDTVNPAQSSEVSGGADKPSSPGCCSRV
jgi:nitrite reductase/ring-hydroxylating ferredoxin subunit